MNIDQFYNRILQSRYLGYDPYDFYSFPLIERLNLPPRLVYPLTYLNKISPINIRNIARVKPYYNSKGMALVALAFLNNPDFYKNELKIIIDWLIKNKSPQFEGYTLGFSFDIALKTYASNPSESSLIISLFAIYAFIEYYKIYKDEKILELVLSFENIIDKQLPKFAGLYSLWYSYNFNKKNEVYNVTAKIGRFYSHLYMIKKVKKYEQIIIKILNYLREKQRADGSWAYSVVNSYSDGFHTAFILEAIWHMLAVVDTDDYYKIFNIGLDNYKTNLFERFEKPLHYHKIHRPPLFRRLLFDSEIRDCATAIILFSKIGEIDFAERIINWTIRNLYNQQKGYFYFFKNKIYTNKIEYIRWQAWMLLALTTFNRYKNG